MRDGLVLHGVEGALGGVLGTLVVKRTIAIGASKLPEKLKPPEIRRDPAELVVSKIEAWRGRPLTPEAHARIARSLPWAYGIGWGSVLGLGVSALRMKTTRRIVLAGATLGALVWGVGYVGWLPRAKVTEPVTRQGAGHVATGLLTHVLYGLAAAVPIAAIDAARRRREPWWERLYDDVEERVDDLRHARFRR
jgi:hypothetical protein